MSDPLSAMRRALQRVMACALLSTVLAFGLCTAGEAAQNAPAIPQEKIALFLTLLADPSVQAFLATKQVVPTPVSSGNPIIAWMSGIHGHIHDVRLAVPQIPDEMGRSADMLASEFAGETSAGLKVAALLLAWLIGDLLISRSVSKWRGWDGSNLADIERASGPAAFDVFTSIAPSLISGAVVIALFMAFDWTPFQLGILLPVIVALVAANVLFKALTSTVSPAPAPMDTGPVPDGTRPGFWRRRGGVLIVLFLGAWLAGEVMEALQFEPHAASAVIDILGAVILAVCGESAWKRRDREGKQRSALRIWLDLSWLCCLWVLWVAGAYLAFWVGVYVLTIPDVLRGISSIGTKKIIANESEGTAIPSVRAVLVERAIRATVIALAVGWLAIVARSHPTALTENVMGNQIMRGSLEGVVVLIAADLVWQVAKAYMNYHLERSQNAADSEAMARNSRMATLLPLFRNVVAVVIAVIAVLTVLSGIGIAIGPLLAGAGIFGVALGFGSQTLVKDVIGGIFYMIDDAFRVGEFIQSGHYKGTVESFSVRSVKLRHNRGPIFIVPFGTLGAVENMSRDWVIEKFTVTVGYETKLDELKKLVKEVGVGLLEDPELGPVIIETLKMKGVEAFGDNGIDVSFALMAKPGSQTMIRRRALAMMRDAFEEHGIDFASRTTQSLSTNSRSIDLMAGPTAAAGGDHRLPQPTVPRPVS
jgi:small-conductance mechanosensitive channel